MDGSDCVSRSASGNLAQWLDAQQVPSALRARRWSLKPAGRHSRCHFFFIRTGTSAVHVSAQPAVLHGPAIVWSPPASGEFIEYAAGASGAMFSADDAMLRRTIDAGADAPRLRRLWDHGLSAAGPGLEPIADELRVSLAVLAREIRVPQRASVALGEAHLTILLLHLWRNTGAALSAIGRSDDRAIVIERFLELIELHFLEHWTVAQYARALEVHDDRLHALCKRLTGRGPLAHMHLRSISEARKRLSQSSLPVEEIAAALGYTDPGYFNRFFKRHVGQSPGLFRRRAIAATLEASAFAAWP